MCKTLMTLHILELINSSLQEVERRSEKISDPNDFLVSETGVILMDSICMKLSAIGESIKNLDKITNHELLPKYSEIPWKNVMGVRDFIVHHYFEAIRPKKPIKPSLEATMFRGRGYRIR